MQAEIPYETIRHAAGMAHRAGVPVLFNPPRYVPWTTS